MINFNPVSCDQQFSLPATTLKGLFIHDKRSALQNCSIRHVSSLVSHDRQFINLIHLWLFDRYIDITVSILMF